LLARVPQTAVADVNKISEERLTLLLEFDAGRAHLIFMVVLKFSHMGETPWILFKLGSWDLVDAHEALRLLLASTSKHPAVVRLREGDLLPKAILWLQGSDILCEELADLCEFVARYRFGPSSDRLGEAQHAKIHGKGPKRKQI